MAEVIAKDGTWTFDGDIIRIVPGRDRGVHKLRQLLGEVAVPLAALAGVAYEPGRKGGRLRLRLRDGACPLLQATGGGLPEEASPYLLKPDKDRSGVAEYFADAVRTALELEQVPDGPVDRYLLPGPAVPLTVGGMDGSAFFDGERIRIEWNWLVEEAKKRWGNRSYTLAELTGVEWMGSVGLEEGGLRFRPQGVRTFLDPDKDPNTLALWGFKKESGAAALLAAAVTVRLPHPNRPRGAAEPEDTPPPRFTKRAEPPEPAPGAAAPPPSAAGGSADDQDAILRRLRELGDLHRDGVLTDEEFAAAKRAILARLEGSG